MRETEIMGTSIDAIRAAREAQFDAEAAREGAATQNARQWARQRRHGVSTKEKKLEDARDFFAKL